jgi:hypothetical protein
VTYFAAIGNAFGYGGIQEVQEAANPIGKVVFSIWDQGCDKDKTPSCDPSLLASTVACGTSATCTDFGGEGTGRKSYMDKLGLPILGREYFMALQAAPAANNTRVQYTGYCFDEIAGWQLLSRIEVSRGSKAWHITSMYAFVEQWTEKNTMKNRSAVFGPSWVSDAATPTTFVQVPSATWNYGRPENHLHVNAYADGGAVGIETGGTVAQTVEEYKRFPYATVSSPCMLNAFKAQVPCLIQASTAITIEACLKTIQTCNSVAPSTVAPTAPGGTLTAAPTRAPSVAPLLVPSALPAQQSSTSPTQQPTQQPCAHAPPDALTHTHAHALAHARDTHAHTHTLIYLRTPSLTH